MDNIRPYKITDSDACLRLFDGNMPRFFDKSERSSFQKFLDGLNQQYHVIERDGRIVACGGHIVQLDNKTACLCWGMVDQILHGQGLGRRLMEARLAAISESSNISRVILGTSQHTKQFYFRFGFVPVDVTPDGYGPGIDRWDMVLLLKV